MSSTLPPFRTGPSSIARYFFHNCDRFLRYTATRSEVAASQGVPKVEFDTSPIMRAILKQGYEWEEQVIAKLGRKAAVAAGEGDLHERQFTWEQSLDLLRKERPGRFIYQATLRPPASFYKDYGLNPALLSFGDNHPDLIQVLPGTDGQRVFRVLDVKRSSTMKASHRIQVLIYALQLEHILREHGIRDALVNTGVGGIWLGGEDAPTECDLVATRPHLECFLRDDLPRVLTTPLEQLDWHVHFRCEWCGYFDACREQMMKTGSISQLGHLSVHGKRHLWHEAGVSTLPELEKFLGRKDADEVLARCANLAGQRPHLQVQVAAFKAGKPILRKASSAALPIFENIALFVTAQDEPLQDRAYLLGLLIQAKQDLQAEVFGESVKEPEIWIAEKDTPEVLAKIRGQFVRRLHTLLRKIDAYNKDREWRDQVSLQIYVHNEHERTVVVDCLMEALLDPNLAEKAMELLLHFHGPDLMLTDEHPQETAHYPVVVLLSALGRLLAVPVPVSYTLPETLTALGSEFEYRRSEFHHFPLGHALRPDPIYLAWTKGKTDNIGHIQRQARMHLFAIRSLLWALRQHAKQYLFAWPPKFLLPKPAALNDPLLSRMAFFAKYESLLQCLQTKDGRSESEEVQRLLGQLIELQALDSTRMKVLTPGIDLSGDFPKWLLVRKSDEGRRAQLEYPDYAYRGKPWGGKPHPDRAVVSVQSLKQDELGFTTELDLNFAKSFDGDPPSKGEKFLLYERYTDYTTDKVINHLCHLDTTGGGLFLELIRDPDKAAKTLKLPAAVEAIAAQEEPKLQLSPSQKLAYQAVRERRAVAIWGPPGTGKTHCLGAMILGLASAYAQAGKPCRILVTAFTHLSIENVLRKVAELRAKGPAGAKALRIAKAGTWQSSGDQPGDSVDPKSMPAWLALGSFSLVGATGYACLKGDNRNLGFDLVIIDEASQVRVPEASIPISLVANSGRLVLAGDHKQLPPIVAGTYPDPPEGEPILHRSIFELMLSRSADGKPTVQKLLENRRMNDVLTSYAAGLIYGSGYKPANKQVASRRLIMQGGRTPELIATCLDPDYPLVMLILQGAPASCENQMEAAIVADLVQHLRQRMRDENGQAFADDAAFFRHGVSIVSPHHVQIQAIRQELARKRKWTCTPFVDTVDKMQGQESLAVVVSYGVSDAEFALQEAEFIYGLNRLNVAVTRAKAKCIVCLPQPLLTATPEVLDIPAAEEGLAYMRGMAAAIEAGGEVREYKLGDGASVRVLRTASPFGSACG